MTLSPAAIRLALIDLALSTGKLTPHAAVKEAYTVGVKDGADMVIEHLDERAAHIPTSENP